MYSIETTDLTKQYNKKVAVDSINLRIKEGELFGLLGVNGAGKTTLIKMLSCLTLPSSGDALLNQYSILSESNKIKKFIGISPQETSIAPNLTVRENLEFMARVFGLDKKGAAESCDRIISELSLGEVKNNRAKILSGGYQRRLSIAMALISRPSILFLDEPTLGLDILARRELWRLIEQLKGETTIILTTHYLEEAEALCDRIAIMSSGKILAVDTPYALIKQAEKKNFEDAFVSIIEGGKK